MQTNMKWYETADYLNSVLHGNIVVRTPKHCKERWKNHVNPDIRRGNWTPAEDLDLLRCYQEMGGRWSLIADQFRHRTENSVKNRINSLIHKERKRAQEMTKEQAVSSLIRKLS